MQQTKPHIRVICRYDFHNKIQQEGLSSIKVKFHEWRFDSRVRPATSTSTTVPLQYIFVTKRRLGIPNPHNRRDNLGISQVTKAISISLHAGLSRGKFQITTRRAFPPLPNFRATAHQIFSFSLQPLVNKSNLKDL